jgi:hypothetical protein
VNDPLARRLAAAALAVALLALTTAAWAAWSAEAELRALRQSIERAVPPQPSPLGPPPALDDEEM